jgi:predicted secreted protein
VPTADILIAVTDGLKGIPEAHLGDPLRVEIVRRNTMESAVDHAQQLPEQHAEFGGRDVQRRTQTFQRLQLGWRGRFSIRGLDASGFLEPD